MIWQSILWICFSGLLFACLHSFTASINCKHWCYQHGLPEPRYRLAYSVLALVTTACWVVFVHQLADAPLYQTHGFDRILLMSVQAIGLVLLLAAFQPIDGLVFLGLRKAIVGTDPFLERGIYRFLRHPMYSGAMLLVLARPMQTWNGLLFSLLICAYFIIGSRFEERRMLKQHPEYAAYRARVAAFIPFVGK